MFFLLSFFPFLLVYSFSVLFFFYRNSRKALESTNEPNPVRSRLEPESEDSRTRSRINADSRPTPEADRLPDMEPATARPRPDSPPRIGRRSTSQRSGNVTLTSSPKANEHHRPRDRPTRSTADWPSRNERPLIGWLGQSRPKRTSPKEEKSAERKKKKIEFKKTTRTQHKITCSHSDEYCNQIKTVLSLSKSIYTTCDK